MKLCVVIPLLSSLTTHISLSKYVSTYPTTPLIRVYVSTRNYCSYVGLWLILAKSRDDQTAIKSTYGFWAVYQLLLAYGTKLASSQ
jgi:hypothetical protein